MNTKEWIRPTVLTIIFFVGFAGFIHYESKHTIGKPFLERLQTTWETGHIERHPPIPPNAFMLKRVMAKNKVELKK